MSHGPIRALSAYHTLLLRDATSRESVCLSLGLATHALWDTNIVNALVEAGMLCIFRILLIEFWD